MSSPPIPISSREGAFDPSVRWFQHAVFYEVLIRGYKDASNDGIGDLRGLREKLDYMEWLGIDCIWMLPFYPSPMRDGGYDISDFFNVHPDYGSIGTSGTTTTRSGPTPGSSSPTSSARTGRGTTTASSTTGTASSTTSRISTTRTPRWPTP